MLVPDTLMAKAATSAEDLELIKSDRSRLERIVRMEEKRGKWTSKLDYILSMIGYSVGLSNIWRFPYLCYQNGGGAFLVPYVVCLFICGVPLFFMEVSLGQFTSRSAATVWSICPLFKGVGWATVVITLTVSTYFNVLLAYAVSFFFQSLTSEPLPWSYCGNPWNTDRCLDYNNKTVYGLFLEYKQWLANDSAGVMNPAYEQFVNVTLRSPSEEFFNNKVLAISSGIDDSQGVVQHLIPCLLTAWVITVLCLIKGVKSSGKVVYFTATFPYVLLTILLIRGVTLDGAIDGIIYYIHPDFSHILKPKVWADAAFQVFFSLGPGWGGLITMGSYNRFRNDCYRDSMILPLLMELTSFYAGFVVFSVLGFMAHVTGKPINEVVAEGPGLAFIMYPEIVTKMPLSQLWSALFFFMVLTVGLDTVFIMVETALTALYDEMPIRYKQRVSRLWILLVACVVMFIIGFMFITHSGMYYLYLVDQYCAFLTVVVICLIELLSIAWFYGASRFASDIRFMIGRDVGPVWEILWRFTTFAVVVAIFFISIGQYSSTLVYGDGYIYPKWSIGVGWVFSLMSLLCIPAHMIWMLLCKVEGDTFVEKLRNSIKPTRFWGPARPDIRLGWESFKTEADYGKSIMDHVSFWKKRSRNITTT